MRLFIAAAVLLCGCGTVRLVGVDGGMEPPDDAGNAPEVDAGKDAGAAFDAGSTDAGAAPDAGVPDAGAPDAGSVDAGQSNPDAGLSGPMLANVWVGAAGSCTRSAALVAYDATRSCGSGQSFDQAYKA